MSEAGGKDPQAKFDEYTADLTWANISFTDNYSSNRENEVADREEANAFSSKLASETGEMNLMTRHKVLMDVDVPMAVIPSTNPEHSHVVFNVECTWGAYVDFMRAAVAVGIMEEGYVDAAESRGAAWLRAPWEKK